jgi:hypothetical protein
MDCDVEWIDTGLHANFGQLEATLKERLLEAAETGRDVKLLFGSGCHPEICRLARQHGAGIPEVKNCIEAFCGVQTRELEKNRTMIMTPGWIRSWRSIMETQGWDEIDARINLGVYDRILLLDPGVVPVSDEEVLEFFDLVQVPVEVQSLDLSCFRECISGLLQDPW